MRPHLRATVVGAIIVLFMVVATAAFATQSSPSEPHHQAQTETFFASGPKAPTQDPALAAGEAQTQVGQYLVTRAVGDYLAARIQADYLASLVPVEPLAPIAQGPVSYNSNPGDFLSCVRNRESGGNYGVYNSGGSGAAGAYQFMQGTWNSIAASSGRGDLVGVDPAQASPGDQDAMAQALYAQQGAGPWGGGC